VGLAAAASLAVAGTAGATLHPVLIVSNLDPILQSQELIVAVPTSDAPVAEATMYVGAGDTLTLSPTKVFGEVVADFMSNADYGNTVFALVGELQAANPAAYTHNSCAPGLHDAVWLARTNPLLFNVEVRIPIYVDRATPAQQSYASYVLKMCMPSPYESFPGGAIFGGRMLDFQLYLDNFQTAASNRWTTVLTPFKAGGGGTDTQAAAEAQAIVNQGSVSTLKIKRVAKKGRGKHKTRYFAHIRGRVTLSNGSGVPATVEIYELFSKFGGPHVKTVKASANGSFHAVVRQKRTASFGVVASELGKEITPAVCNPVLQIGFGPLPCASLTSSDFFSARVSKKVHIPKGGRGVPAGRATAIMHSRFLSRVRGRISP
jgi:hypothetical protein